MDADTLRALIREELASALEAVRAIVREEIARIPTPRPSVEAAPDDADAAALDAERRARLAEAGEWIGYREAAGFLGYNVRALQSGNHVSVKRHGSYKEGRYRRDDLLDYLRRRDEAGWTTVHAAAMRLDDADGSWVERATFPSALRGGIRMLPVLEVEALYEQERHDIEYWRSMTPQERRRAEEALAHDAMEGLRVRSKVKPRPPEPSDKDRKTEREIALRMGMHVREPR